MKRRTFLTLASLLLGTSLLLGACGSKSSGGQEGDQNSEPAAGSEAPAAENKKDSGGEKLGGEVTVYSALPEEELPFYINSFEKDTGVKVHYVRLSAGEMITRLEAEKENPNASLIFGGSSDTYIAAAKNDLLEPYQSPENSNVPEQYRDAEKVWNPIYVGAICFACNSDWFESNGVDYPKTWNDLLKPEFKDQISMAHPSTSGTSYTVLSTMVQLMGEDEAIDFMKKLNTNVRQYTKAGAAPPMEVGLGEAAIAVTFSHDALKPASEGYPIKVVFPEDGTGYEVGAAALVKGGKPEEQEQAKAFIDWLMSVRGQECYIESKSNRLPINVNAKVTEGLQQLDELNVIDYDAVWSGENRERLVERFINEVDGAKDLKQ